jgi:hypothetical protein
MRVFFFLLATIVIIPGSAATDRVPAFDIERSCDSEAQVAVHVQQTKAHCKEDETNAKKELAQKWSKFGGDPKRQCIAESATSDDQSYVELLTCLQMSTEWKRQPVTIGQAKRRH